MAGAGFKTWTAGEVLTAAGLNTYIQQQTVGVYASSAARSSAVGTAIAEGFVSYLTDTNALEYYDGSAWVGLGNVTTTGIQTLTNKTLTSPSEYTNVSATAATGTINYDVVTQADLFYTTNASANFTLNVRGNSSTTLNNFMVNGETHTIAFRVTNGSTAYYMTTFQIDGTTVTPKWQGGSAPTSGNASSVDVYTFVITKTGSATFQVFAAQTRFA